MRRRADEVDTFAGVRALRAKERRENRPALIVGLIVFVGLPALWSAITAAIDLRHDPVAGIGTALLILVGWLFAAVIGAQAVTRDIGRAEGNFLLALPIAPRRIFRVKFWAGARTLAIIAAASITLDFCLGRSTHGRGYAESETIDVIEFLALALGLLLGGYVLAVWAASYFKQALLSVMAAGLTLLLLALAPLINSRLGAVWQQPAEELLAFLRQRSWVARSTTAFDIAALLFVIPALTSVLVLYFSGPTLLTTRRRLQLGSKPVASTVALVLLAMFLSSLNEVGSSLAPSTNYWQAGQIYSPHLSVVSRRVARSYYSYSDRRSFTWMVECFDVDSAGQVSRARQFTRELNPPPATQVFSTLQPLGRLVAPAEPDEFCRRPRPCVGHQQRRRDLL